MTHNLLICPFSEQRYTILNLCTFFGTPGIIIIIIVIIIIIIIIIILNFLIKNSYVESDIQKGFWDNVPGTIEHNELLTYMINHARKRQRDLFVTLIYLRNAFGEVHHSL